MRSFACLQEFFANWRDEGVVNLIDVLSELIILTASRTLLGENPTQISYLDSQSFFWYAELSLKLRSRPSYFSEAVCISAVWGSHPRI